MNNEDDTIVCDSSKSLLSSNTITTNEDEMLYSNKSKKSVRFSEKEQIILIPTRFENKIYGKMVTFDKNNKIYNIPTRKYLLSKQYDLWYTSDEIQKLTEETFKAINKCLFQEKK